MKGTADSIRDVRKYVEGDRILCLICGKPFKAVCHHARLAHDISARDYKKRFGLPVSRGVVTADLKISWSRAIKATRANERLPMAPKNGPPPPGPYDKPPYTTRDMRQVDPETIESLLFWVHKGDTLTEACKRPGMPRWTWLHDQIDRDTAMRARFDAAIESLPFSQQARMKKLGARFAHAVANRLGWTALAIANDLGVSQEAVRRQILRNRK